MEDPAPQILKEHLVANPGFPFLETVLVPGFFDQAMELVWWHKAYLWEQRQMRVNPRRFSKVEGSLDSLLRDPDRMRRYASRSADQFVAAFDDLLASGALYFDDAGDLRASDADIDE